MGLKEKIEAIVDPAVGPTLDIVSDICLDGVAGALVPGVGSLLLSYKQQRFEKHIEECIRVLIARMDEINLILGERDQLFVDKMKGEFLPLLFDGVIEEKQKEKISFMVNGYIETARIENPLIDNILGLQSVLLQLSFADIRMLKCYYYKFGTNETLDDYFSILSEYNIENSQAIMIKEKLVRLGLLESKNDNQRDANIDAVYEFLMGVEKGKKNNKLKAKKVSNTDTYKMTNFGRKFVEHYVYESKH